MSKAIKFKVIKPNLQILLKLNLSTVDWIDEAKLLKETLVIFKSTVNLKKKGKLKSKVQEFSRLFESRRLKCLNKICR